MVAVRITAIEARALESTVYGDLEVAIVHGEKKTILENLIKKGYVTIKQDPEGWDDAQYYKITSTGRLELNIFEKSDPAWRLKTPALSNG
jgi:DNA-binding PadR family transcriptional regulator